VNITGSGIFAKNVVAVPSVNITGSELLALFNRGFAKYALQPKHVQEYVGPVRTRWDLQKKFLLKLQ
jgi:hypothetical protein